MHESELGVRIDKIFKDATCYGKCINKWDMSNKEKQRNLFTCSARINRFFFYKKHMCVREAKSNWNQYAYHIILEIKPTNSATMNDQWLILMLSNIGLITAWQLNPNFFQNFFNCIIKYIYYSLKHKKYFLAHVT